MHHCWLVSGNVISEKKRFCNIAIAPEIPPYKDSTPPSIAGVPASRRASLRSLFVFVEYQLTDHKVNQPFRTLIWLIGC